MTITSNIQKFCSAAGEHHRYRSWEHCYGYFHNATPERLAAERDHAALQLGFYLASWGMYRGSSFLLQHDFTVHRPVVDLLCEDRFCDLRACDFGASVSHSSMIPLVWELAQAIRATYQPFATKIGSGVPSDTLVTKVILGTVGCLPACDRYFVNGFKSEYKFTSLNPKFIDDVFGFCQKHLAELQAEQTRIQQASQVHYPLMKLIDMHFWQQGCDLEKNNSGKNK